ncbi:MAG TPA: histidinol-phosphate transaminase [Clostridia bacterium]|nr:histidinol-phosphate transaminase [Clostridia bacterium]
MAFVLNKKIKNLEPYSPVSGEYRIRLDANESFILPDEEIMQSIEQSMSKIKFNRYPDPYATKLCKLFASFYGVKSELVTAGNGSDELISIIMSAFTQKGDTIICSPPDFSMYKFYSQISESDCIEVNKKEDFSFDVDGLIKTANSSNARIVVFSNPCNPTSVGLEREEVRRLVKSVDSLIVLDEAYMDFYDQTLIEEVEEHDNLIVLRTCSKAVGMASIRLGFAVANPKLTTIIKSVKSPYNVNSVTQAIGCAVFSNPDYIKKSIDRINASRDFLAEELKKLEAKHPEKLKIIACSANFVYTKIYNASEMYEFLKKEGIIVRNFGDYLRITAGRNYENAQLINAAERFLNGGEGE